MAMGVRWYVVHTQAQGEGRADLNLRRQGFVTYLPRYLRTRRHARRVETVARPLFPRYLFVAMDVARDRWRAVQSTFGVSGLVVVGDDPVALPDGVLDEIRTRECEQGFVKLGLPAGVGPGSSVRLVDGVFAEYRGVLERLAGELRVAVLLKLLGREVRVFVPVASVGAV
jgi:transcriptional antiterminator RfaH